MTVQQPLYQFPAQSNIIFVLIFAHTLIIQLFMNFLVTLNTQQLKTLLNLEISIQDKSHIVCDCKSLKYDEVFLDNYVSLLL